MSIIKKVFYYEKTKLPIIKYKDDAIYINEARLYSIILCSKLESAQVFK